jgi:hypothetical protein
MPSRPTRGASAASHDAGRGAVAAIGVPRRPPLAQRPKPRGPGAPFTCVAWGSRRQRRNPAAGRQALSRSQ